jgi:acetate kinase
MSSSRGEPGEASRSAPHRERPYLLTANGGSSSLKIALYDFDSPRTSSPRRISGVLAQVAAFSAEAFHRMANHESGLLGARDSARVLLLGE